MSPRSSHADSADGRNRLLDAADACFARYGVMKTTMADVAAEAGISRATLYRYFGDRDQLILGVLLREAPCLDVRKRLLPLDTHTLLSWAIHDVVYHAHHHT